MANIGIGTRILEFFKTRNPNAIQEFTKDEIWMVGSFSKYCEKDKFISALFDLAHDGILIESRHGGSTFYKLPDQQNKKQIETISLVPKIKVQMAPLLDINWPQPEVTQPKLTAQSGEISMIEILENEPKTNNYKMLKFISLNPNCSAKDIEKGTGCAAKNIGNYLSAYIKDGTVSVDKRSRQFLYKLTKPLNEAYQGVGHRAIQKKTSIDDASPADWDALKKSVAPVPAEPVQKPQQAKQEAKTIDKFRCAYTSDGCLILMDLNDYGLPLELNASQTLKLTKFLAAIPQPN